MFAPAKAPRTNCKPDVTRCRCGKSRAVPAAIIVALSGQKVASGEAKTATRGRDWGFERRPKDKPNSHEL
jgi:hypothetical protein